MFQTQSMPQAHLTINRNRVKTYGNAVYMKDKTNFEIEIFNPLTTSVKADIEIDGKIISEGGLVIKPGQRVYLERWISESRKFLFETYQVENSGEAIAAISNNGKVKISFFNEYVSQPQYKHSVRSYGGGSTSSSYCKGMMGTNGSSGISGSSISSNLPHYCNSPVFGNGTSTTGAFFSSTVSSTPISGSITVSNTSNLGTLDFMNNSTLSNGSNIQLNSQADSLETGKAEMGDISNQQLETVNGNFSSTSFATVDYQLLPESKKPIDIDKIRSYCPNCGTRVRSASWKFCSSCGEKL